MSNRDKIMNYLRTRKEGKYCDDCLSSILKIYPRQQINQICRNLLDMGYIRREKGLCSNCSKYKIVNFLETPDDIISSEKILQSSDKMLEQRLAQGKRLHHKAFEYRVSEYLQNKFGQRFYEQNMQIGPDKYHNFDLVSEDRAIVVECKSYTWTESGNFPSAKISTAVEAIFYLSRIKAKRKILVFQDNFNSRGESLVDMFVRRYNGVLDDIEVWAYHAEESPEKDLVRIVRTSKDNWYEKIYRG